MKKIVIWLIVIVTSVVTISEIAGGTLGLSYNSSERCTLCGDTPTHHFDTNEYEFYLCKDCTTHCQLCGASGATMYEECLFSEIQILCKDCYKEQVEIGGFKYRKWKY